MKYIKICILFFIFTVLLVTISFATDEENSFENIDISQIVENFNEHSYVSKLSSIGINISAVQAGNSIILRYDGNDILTYVYDDSQETLSTYYSSFQSEYADIVNSIFIDTISSMQGNVEGVQIPFALDDTFCFFSYRDSGIEKIYTTAEDGSILTKFTIKPSITLPINETSSAITDSQYLTEYETFYTNDDCIVKNDGLIFYKTYNNAGALEIYIGQADELNEFAYDSLLNAIAILFRNGTVYSKEVKAYFLQNYTGFEVGDAEFSGVSIDTSIEALPIVNIDTIMVTPNMKYAKIVIDEATVKEELPNVVLEDENAKVSSSSNNKFSSPMIFSIVIVCMVIIIMLIGFLVRKNQN